MRAGRTRAVEAASTALSSMCGLVAGPAEGDQVLCAVRGQEPRLPLDEHAPRPQAQHAAAEPGPEQRGGGGGEGDVIADSHHAAAGRWPFWRYHAMLRSVPVGRSVAAAKPSTRCAFETS